MEPIVLFGIQFTLSLVAYALLAAWYVVTSVVDDALDGRRWCRCSGPRLSGGRWDDPGPGRGRPRRARLSFGRWSEWATWRPR